MNKKNICYWLLLPVLALLMGACGKSDDEEVFTPDVNVGETVTDFKKTVKYEDTKQFLTDRDAITGMMLNLYGIRWSYWRMVSNDFKNGLSDFFSVPPDETGKDTPDMLKAASRRKEATVFVPASFDKKDELQSLIKDEKYYIHTYGCQANVRDEETMRGMLEDVGFVQTDKQEDASVIIINTCAVRENAEDKVYGEIGNQRFLEEKTKNSF